MAWKTLDDMDLDGKVVLMRVDINVPMEGGRVTDATRIEKIVPTVEDILAKGGKLVLLAHFGRPKGKVVPEMSLRACPARAGGGAAGARWSSPRIASARPATAAMAAMRPGDVVLLENTRFHAGRGKERPGAGRRRWRHLGDVYSTTPSRRRTGPMPRPKAWRGCCRTARGG